MSQLYQQLLLVQHIPAIEGIAGIQDLIKAFAYRGDLYREKAKEFGERCKPVLCEINGIIIVTADCIWTHISQKYLQGRLSIFNSRFCSFCGDYHTLQYFRKHKKNKYPECKCLDIHA